MQWFQPLKLLQKAEQKATEMLTYFNNQFLNINLKINLHNTSRPIDIILKQFFLYFLFLGNLIFLQLEFELDFCNKLNFYLH